MVSYGDATDSLSEKAAVLGSKKEEMKQRTQHLRHVCSQYPRRRLLDAVLKPTGRLFYISEKYKLSYCRVAKVGSTFWTQVFMALAGVKPGTALASENESLFNIARDESHDAMKNMEHLTMEPTDQRIHSTTSFLVARSPYSRLFSSYIDQVFLPNKWYKAAKMIENEKDKRKRCGNDLTFNEFLLGISHFMIEKKPNDPHWSPIFSLCTPCETQIDIIAKQEQFNEDAEYILDLAGVEQSVRDEVKNALKEDYTEHYIPNMIRTYVAKAHDENNIKKNCVSERKIAELIWNAFHIQGYVHNDIKFPSDRFSSSSNSDTVDNLSKLVVEAVKQHPVSSEERDKQRHDWQVHYWKQIAPTTLEKVQDAFYEDFLAFQYDMDPNKM